MYRGSKPWVYRGRAYDGKHSPFATCSFSELSLLQQYELLLEPLLERDVAHAELPKTTRELTRREMSESAWSRRRGRTQSVNLISAINPPKSRRKQVSVVHIHEHFVQQEFRILTLLRDTDRKSQPSCGCERIL